ncbi:ABC transporter ATP-binding protein [Natronococcus jeotgali]|uniref:Copper ABC transporter ATP-binding protein n=1 Tax=Natronococcus jeotgali DSM 18795 TaxID=1227498 RepID=L9XF55_9EURY|nr:copper ABC transporter ATP-binding protein [Natronococcus jeotgali DSM 18795]
MTTERYDSGRTNQPPTDDGPAADSDPAVTDGSGVRVTSDRAPDADLATDGGPEAADVTLAADRDAASSDVLLNASSVAFAYGDVQVLDDVSVTVPAGDVTALIGPNGAGKTTLLRALAGLHEATGGTVEYLGPDVPRPIGYLPQRPSFRPGFTVVETLEFYASLVGEDREDVLNRLDRVGLRAAAERRVGALSGGMTRLVGIAQAIIGDPTVVVLDEPASGLDPGMSTRVFDIARDLADRGTAVLLTSHDLAFVERTADQVLLLDDGVVTERGHPEEILDRIGVDTLQEAYEASVTGDLQQVRVRGESA